MALTQCLPAKTFVSEAAGHEPNPSDLRRAAEDQFGELEDGLLADLSKKAMPAELCALPLLSKIDSP